jgi:hypothetical protein
MSPMVNFEAAGMGGAVWSGMGDDTVAFRSIRKAAWGVTSQMTWTFRMRSPFGNLIRRYPSATLG